MSTRMEQISKRAEVYVSQPTGYRAFITKPLPPEPPQNSCLLGFVWVSETLTKDFAITMANRF